MSPPTLLYTLLLLIAVEASNLATALKKRLRKDPTHER